MVSKQLPWRRSNRVLSLFFLFIVCSPTFSMDFVRASYRWWQYKYTQQEQDEVKLYNGDVNPYETSAGAEYNAEYNNEYALVPAMTDEQKKKYVARGKSWQELMEVLHDAPESMRDIVDHLKYNLDPEWRAAFIVGPPGTGKTTAALAVPHCARWYWKFLSAPALAAQYRNEAKERLAGELASVLSHKKKTVVIVDELNRLLENFDSKGHDNDTTSSYLWTFLDEQKRNENFFFIGTMNRDDKVPDPIKHRFGGSTIYFPPIKDAHKLCTIFKKVIARNSALIFDEACDDAFFNSCFCSLANEGIELTPRDYENIRFQLARLTWRDDRTSAVRTVKRAHVAKAMSEVSKAYTRSGLGREHLSDEEWRDFNVVQSRIVEVKLNGAQTSHTSYGFSGIMPVINRGSPGGFDEEKAARIIEQEFSPDQIALYRRVMKLKSEDSLFKRYTTAKKG